MKIGEGQLARRGVDFHHPTPLLRTCDISGNGLLPIVAEVSDIDILESEYEVDTERPALFLEPRLLHG